MIGLYRGHYDYTKNKVEEILDPELIGVYYCGYIDYRGYMNTLYIGSAVGQHGIRGRLLEHMRLDDWEDVTHFGYRACSKPEISLEFEAEEISKHKPRYNIRGSNVIE